MLIRVLSVNKATTWKVVKVVNKTQLVYGQVKIRLLKIAFYLILKVLVKYAEIDIT